MAAARASITSPGYAATAGPRTVEPDRDSLHILPLCDLPLETPQLRNARLIKNMRLNTVIELFRSSQTGSGQVEVDGFARQAGWNMTEPPTDLVVLHLLEALPSFDVYSLRILLRANGIPVNDRAAKRLPRPNIAI